MDIVNEKASFDKDDVFDRLEFVKKAMELIANHQSGRGACVIDLDAPWGMGKTTLLKMWINDLEKEDEQQRKLNLDYQCQCVYYNAWENDYYGDALAPLIYAICGNIYIKAKKKDTWLAGLKEKVGDMISAWAGFATSYLCYQNTGNDVLASGAGALATEAVKTGLHVLEGREPEEIGEEYSKALEKREAFYNAVLNLANSCGKLFIFIDELDRCKPTFAIQTLECIKHYFNIPNIVFVFATDMSQLAHTVEAYYGRGMDAGGYFLKFFDYIMHLPIPNIRILMHYAYPTTKVDNEFYEYVNEIRRVFNLTPREMPWIIHKANMVWQGAFANRRRGNLSASFAFIAFMIAVKTKAPNRFAMWLTAKDDLSDLFQGNTDTFIGQCASFLCDHLKLDTFSLENEISESIQQKQKKLVDGITDNKINYQKVFLDTTYVVCASQMSVSQTVGEALLASLELC